MAMQRTEDGLIIFARRPCYRNCGCDEAVTEEELERIRATAEHRRRSRRVLLPSEEQEVRRSFRGRSPGSRSNAAALADRFRVTTRTIYRIVQGGGGRALCPGADGRGCATTTPGGRLCAFCRRTEELSR